MRESIKSRGKSSDSVLISSAFGGDSTQDYSYFKMIVNNPLVMMSNVID
jgi:hypothetical protein